MQSIDIEREYYVAALLVMLGTGILCFYRKRNLLVSMAWAFLAGYLFLIYSSTVIRRDVGKEYDYDFHIFWSYIAAWKRGKTYLLYLNIANTMMLLPVGFLAGYIGINDYKCALLLGAGISGVIEMSQLLLKRGMFEFDDILHNALGCLLGYLVYQAVKWMIEKIWSREKKNPCHIP